LVKNVRLSDSPEEEKNQDQEAEGQRQKPAGEEVRGRELHSKYIL
jgi:hypothetical protein